MAASPLELYPELIDRRHQRPCRDREIANVEPRHVVHPIDLVDGKAGEEPVLDHGLAARPALLGRLEDDGDRAIKGAALGQMPGGAKQHGGMPVMATCMHLARYLRGPGRAGLLDDRQRIHIGAEPDHAPAPVALAANDADDPGPADALMHLVDASGAERIGHTPGRPVYIIEQLRVLMEITAELGEIGDLSCDPVLDSHGNQPFLPPRSPCRFWPEISN